MELLAVSTGASVASVGAKDGARLARPAPAGWGVVGTVFGLGISSNHVLSQRPKLDAGLSANLR